MNRDLPTPAVFLGQTPVDWLANGGTAANGVTYGEPQSARAWGTVGCPLLPRVIREHQSGRNLPEALTQVLGGASTCDDLGFNILERSGVNELTDAQKSVFREFLYELGLDQNAVVIPAGVPLDYMRKLPISGRTRGAVNRAFLARKSETFLIAPFFLHQFLALHSVGPMAYIDLACVMESVEVDDQNSDRARQLNGTENLSIGQMSMSGPYFEGTVNQAALEIIQESSPLTASMYRFAKWALAETQATTLGDALAEILRRPTGTRAWASVASIRLAELISPPAHPYEIMDAWSMTQEPRSRTVFWARVSESTPRVTLQELAAEFGVSRERIRQVEVRVRHAFQRFLSEDESAPIHWRAESIGQILGVAGKFNTVEEKLTAPDHCRDYSKIVLELAGPYVTEKGWYVLESALQDEPTPRILGQADEAGRIDFELASRCLTEWGLETAYHHDWLTRNGDIRHFNNHLVYWGTSVNDRLVFALADLGSPATIDELMRHIGEDRSRQSAVNAASSDARLVRVSRTHWGLSSWDLPEYAGTAYSMRSLLVEAGGSMSIDEVVLKMSRTFQVSEGTTRTYCQCPMFVTKGNTIRLRTQEDEPYKLNMESIDRATGVFHLGSGRVGLLLKVDHNMLRGSGTMLPRAAGAILQVDVNANLEFADRLGNLVMVTFPETAFMGPSLGSIRLIAENLSVDEGDSLTLVLDQSSMSVEAMATKPDGLYPSWETVSRLTGITEPVNMAKLADSLYCPVGDVRERLKERGDLEVLNALPKPKTSHKLADALSMLQSQVEKGRR